MEYSVNIILFSIFSSLIKSKNTNIIINDIYHTSKFFKIIYAICNLYFFYILCDFLSYINNYIDSLIFVFMISNFNSKSKMLFVYLYSFFYEFKNIIIINSLIYNLIYLFINFFNDEIIYYSLGLLNYLEYTALLPKEPIILTDLITSMFYLNN